MITGRRTTVRECRIDNDAFGIFVHSSGDCVIEHNEIFGNTNAASSARGNGIHLWNTRHNRIPANIIHDKRDGMCFSYADDNWIANYRVYDTRFGIHYMYWHQNRLLTNSLTHNAIGATLMFNQPLPTVAWGRDDMGIGR
jgi:nitrous oxidase accessory protein